VRRRSAANSSLASSESAAAAFCLVTDLLDRGFDCLVTLAQHLLEPCLVERWIGRLPKLARDLAFVVDLKARRGLADRDCADVHLVFRPFGNGHGLLDEAARCLDALLDPQPAVLQLGLARLHAGDQDFVFFDCQHGAADLSVKRGLAVEGVAQRFEVIRRHIAAGFARDQPGKLLAQRYRGIDGAVQIVRRDLAHILSG
jgi:hypothetical protein